MSWVFGEYEKKIGAIYPHDLNQYETEFVLQRYGD